MVRIQRKRILKKLSGMDVHEVGGGGRDTERHKLDIHKKRVSDSESSREERGKEKRIKSSKKKHHRHRDDIRGEKKIEV